MFASLFRPTRAVGAAFCVLLTVALSGAVVADEADSILDGIPLDRPAVGGALAAPAQDEPAGDEEERRRHENEEHERGHDEEREPSEQRFRHEEERREEERFSHEEHDEHAERDFEHEHDEEAEHHERDIEHREAEEHERREHDIEHHEAEERAHHDRDGGREVHEEREQRQHRVEREDGEPRHRVVVLHLHPGDVPRPAMRFALLPPFLDRTPGNAAPLYMKAFLLLNEPEHEAMEDIVHWLEMPPEELPREEAWEVTGERFEAALHYAEMASRRNTCQWELPLREEENIFGMLLPELQKARNLGRVIALRARLHILERDYEGAMHQLQTGFALARDVSRQPTLVSGLVGIAIARLMLDQVDLLVQQPGLPSLYWTLARLPDPVVDLRAGLEMEAQSLFLVFPELRHIEEGPRPPEEWQHLLHEVGERLMGLSGPPREENRRLREMLGQMVQTAYLAAVYPGVRRHLVEMGYSEEEVEQMTPAQGILLHTVRNYTDLRDDMFKWFHVPYWQAERGILESQGRIENARGREIIPLASLVLPAVGRCRATEAELQRRVAALLCVEAIRAHMARHEGRLPEEFDAADGLPVPIDPVTGKAFGYHFEGEMVVLLGEGTELVEPVEYHLHAVR